MKKWVLYIVVLLAVSCEKSEPSNPYYTDQQLQILNELCGVNGWTSPQGSTSVGSWWFVRINNQPFRIQGIEPDTVILADGIAYFQRHITWFYYYYKLISDTEIKFFYIKYTTGNYGVLNGIIDNTPHIQIPCN